MTQEELDALMSGDLDTLEEESIEEPSSEEEEISDEELMVHDSETYRVAATHSWPPPPPTDDHKMVHQLDDVTKESEEKATEIFDIIEGIGNDLMESESKAQEASDVMKSNVELFTKLCEKFPDIEAFRVQLERNETALAHTDEMLDVLQTSGDSIMNMMDIMQYQDIHRQKIERVINVMRALSAYMNLLFEGKIDDEKRVSTAVHLPGDQTTADIVNSDDIEELLKSFGQK